MLHIVHCVCNYKLGANGLCRNSYIINCYQEKLTTVVEYFCKLYKFSCNIIRSFESIESVFTRCRVLLFGRFTHAICNIVYRLQPSQILQKRSVNLKLSGFERC